jgi:hypothetical protein
MTSVETMKNTIEIRLPYGHSSGVVFPAPKRVVRDKHLGLTSLNHMEKYIRGLADNRLPSLRSLREADHPSDCGFSDLRRTLQHSKMMFAENFPSALI